MEKKILHTAFVQAIIVNTYYTGATASGAGRGDCGGRGDMGSPIIVEYRFPREDTDTLSPFVLAVEEALLAAFGASGAEAIRAGG